MTNIFPGDSVIYTIIFNLSIQIDQFKWAQLNFPIPPPVSCVPFPTVSMNEVPGPFYTFWKRMYFYLFIAQI